MSASNLPGVTITPLEDGPYLVSGTVRLIAHDGRELPQAERIALCRCGHSRNKPFCDGTHRTVAFDGTLAGDRNRAD